MVRSKAMVEMNTAMSGKSTSTEGAKGCTVRVHEGFGRVNVRRWYPSTKQQGYGKGKQGVRSHGRAQLVVEELWVKWGGKAMGSQQWQSVGTDWDAGECAATGERRYRCRRGVRCHRKAGLRGGSQHSGAFPTGKRGSVVGAAQRCPA